jgi:hypothetical protein
MAWFNARASCHKESSISTTTLPSTHLAATLVSVLFNVAQEQWQRLISYLVRSFTIKSGVVPDASISSRVWEVQTASVRAPAARPAINPDGASSTTRPAVPRACSAAGVIPHAKRGLTVLRVYPDALSASDVGVRLWLAMLDIVGSHVARSRLLYACARECFRGVNVCG